MQLGSPLTTADECHLTPRATACLLVCCFVPHHQPHTVRRIAHPPPTGTLPLCASLGAHAGTQTKAPNRTLTSPQPCTLAQGSQPGNPRPAPKPSPRFQPTELRGQLSIATQLTAHSPARPSPAQPSPAQPSPAQPSPRMSAEPVPGAPQPVPARAPNPQPETPNSRPTYAPGPLVSTRTAFWTPSCDAPCKIYPRST
jgi:hypothetical protein